MRQRPTDGDDEPSPVLLLFLLAKLRSVPASAQQPAWREMSIHGHGWTRSEARGNRHASRMPASDQQRACHASEIKRCGEEEEEEEEDKEDRPVIGHSIDRSTA
jgi:hypothetical protein